jgi:DNA replication licensing factor MCM4
VLREEYIKMRSEGQSRKTISATPRQLESLIRISEAFAKMRLSQEVSEEDVKQAIHLMQTATLRSATDPETGIVNMEMITTGKSASIRKREEEVASKIRELIRANESLFRNATTI